MDRKGYLLLFVLLSLFCSKARCQWDGANKVFYSSKYNIKWDLSEFGDWYVVDSQKLPENMVFCASLEGDMCVVSMMVHESPAPVDIWDDNLNKDFLKGFADGAKDVTSAFPGIKFLDLKYNKAHLLFKKALKCHMPCVVNDIRINDGKLTSFLYYGYIYCLGKSVITSAVVLPLDYVVEYGFEAADMFFKTIDYIDARKNFK